MPEKRGYKITAQYERLRLSDEAGAADVSQGVAVTPLALSRAISDFAEGEAAKIATDEEVREALDEIFG